MFFPYADEPPREGRRLPWMTWLLIAANVWIFINFGLRPEKEYEAIILKYGFIPAIFRPVTLLTSMFLHGDLMHLLGNMWFLFLFGPNVETRCGPFKYLFAYMVSGLAGAMSQYMFFSDSYVPSIGASGAIFGILGMYLFFFPANRVKVFYFIFVFIGVMVVRAIWVIGSFFLLEVLYSRLQTLSGIETGVGHLAHSGGFLAGVLLAGAYTLLGLVLDDRRHLLARFSGRGASDGGAEPSFGAQFRTRAEEAGSEEMPSNDPRYQIISLLRAGRTDEAKRAWRRYAFDNQEGVLPVREQLEVALALDKNKERGVARDAYERLLAHYPEAQPYSAEANLALAGMLLQEIKETGDEKELPLVRRLLHAAAETHPRQSRRELALRWLQAIGNAL